ncbi:hypothetical protein SKAU_G00394060 [Synaphobranchus kaupii]|uniref:Uncharacterized protein n=1 Tax=Synaphobranchus kaupii TaxID=118154 RepID=A0A9Q1EC29_SYNKA|nr:hypothetical protein SKAU_G00394060 [Synaphobranchus kaupii]
MRLENSIAHSKGIETIPPERISPDPSKSLVDSPLQLTPQVFNGVHPGQGDRDGHCKTLILWSINHFCVDFEVCFGMHCPAGRSNHDPRLAFWQRKPGVSLKLPGM